MIIPRKSFIAAAMGTMVEYYDYALFTIFLPITAPLFFPANSAYQSLVKGFYVMLIAMLARPLGGIFFGYMGDVFGRRKALLTSMYGIAFATFLIGMTPSYATIGISSTILITVAKAIQIFCFGGEYNGAGIYVVEHANQKNEAYIGSLLTAMMLSGSLVASLMGVMITFTSMPNWSWRIAFFLGGIIGIIGICSRKNLTESPHYRENRTKDNSLKNLIKHYPRQLIAGVFIGGFATVPFTTVLAFITPVLMTKGFMSSQQFMLTQSLLIFIAIITLVLAGRLADVRSPLNIMQIGASLLVVIPFPILLWMDKGGVLSFVVASSLLIVINEILLGPSNAFLKNLFPMHYRYRGSSLGFTLGMSLFGGLTPVIESYLYEQTGHFSTISLWLMFLGIGTWASIRAASHPKTLTVVSTS